MKKILPIVFLPILFFGGFSLSAPISVLAQTVTPSVTPTVAPTAIPSSTPTPTSTSSAGTKGGVSTSSTTLPEELPVTGAYDYLALMIIGGLMLIGLAGVARVKLVERLES